MAHELDNNLITGKKAMFSVRESAWHKEGIVLEQAPTMADALMLAGCDYDVVLHDLYVQVGDVDNQLMQKTAIGKAVVRTDTNATLGIVRERYTPLANRDAFSVLEPLLDRGVASLETGGTLRGGRDAWMMAKFNISDPVVQEVFADEVIPFALITNNHAGESRCIVTETPIRVVCANTLGMALTGWRERGNAIAVAHRGDARVKIVEAAERMFKGLSDRYRIIGKQYAQLKATRLSVDEFVANVLDVAAPLPKPINEHTGEHLTSRGYDLAYDLAERRRSAIQHAWHHGKGHSGDDSAWEAYNGAVEVIDHNVELYRTYKSRVSAMIAGRLIESKSAVLNAVMKHCIAN